MTGTADIDAGPGKRVTVEVSEGMAEREKFSFLIEEGEMPRRYRAVIDGKVIKGEVTFEGTTELSGIKTPFDGVEK